MAWRRTSVNIRKCLPLITVGVLLVVIVSAQNSANKGWQTYSPDAASFSIQVPGVPLPAQGHIFDPGDNETAHRLIGHGLCSRAYNFEVNKEGKRSFLVSILDVQTTKDRHHKFITDSEVNRIDSVIGDDIEHSKVLRRATKNGEVSQWGYKRKRGSKTDGEDDGMVYVRRWGTHMFIVVVDYDYVEVGDPELKAMLDSLRMH